ncbi:MAG: hypothetical protein JWO07_667 [Candidatus Saccharibacteria bacterium]|nr:hypothetical protein [Candidatus Saccharibacteria bacterium]
MARKQLGSTPTGNSDASTKNYVDALINSRTSNMILDGDFENTAVWANAFGAMSTVQKYSGTQSRLIVSTGAGSATDRLVLTHNAVGSPLQVSAPDGSAYYCEVTIYRPSTNTGTGNLSIEIHAVSTTGVDTVAAANTFAQSTITTNTWTTVFIAADTTTLLPAGTAYMYAMVGIVSAPLGDKYYIDRAYLLDCTDTAYKLNSYDFSTKGDMLVGISPDVYSAFSVGSNGSVLVADSTQTNGMKWGVATPRIGTTTSTATPTIDVTLYDQYNITALATNITSLGVTGTGADGQKLMIRIKGAASQTIVWSSSFVSSGVATLPAATVAGKTHLVGFIYDGVLTKWVCVAVDATGY